MVPDTQPNEADCGGADRVHRTFTLSLMHLSTLSSLSHSVSRLENVESCEKSDFNISIRDVGSGIRGRARGGGKKKTKISAATDSSPKYTKTQKFEKRKTKNHVEH